MKPLYWTRIQVPVTTPIAESKPTSPENGTAVTNGGATTAVEEKDRSPSSCLWEKIDEDTEVKQSFISRFAEIFSRQPIKKKEKEKKESPKKAKQVCVLLL